MEMCTRQAKEIVWHDMNKQTWIRPKVYISISSSAEE